MKAVRGFMGAILLGSGAEVIAGASRCRIPRAGESVTAS
jgi:hypothetical protein